MRARISSAGSSRQRSAVRRSCQTIAGYTGSPLRRSQTTVVSRWFVIPIAARSPAASPASASAAAAAGSTLAHSSHGSCSTQPGPGGRHGDRRVAAAQHLEPVADDEACRAGRALVDREDHGRILAQYPYRAEGISVLADGRAGALKDDQGMGRRLAVACAALAALAAAPAAAAPLTNITLKIGDAVDVVGTPMACFAVHSNNKDGLGCLLWQGSKPQVGTYAVGLAVDGTASLTKLKADGTSQKIFKRKLQAARKTYKAHPGDLFGFQVNSSLAIACEVINVTTTAVAPLGRGVKVVCLRSNGTTAIPTSYFVTISAKFASVSKFDAKSNPSTWALVKQQP